MKQTAIVYSRVSTLEQNTEAQLNSIMNYCTSRNFEVIHAPFVEKISGMVPGTQRQEMNLLLEFIEKTKVDNLVVYELTRLGRTIKNVHDIVNELTIRKINLHCIKDSIVTLDEKGNKSMTGIVMVSLLAVFSEFEHSSIIERTTNGKRYNAIEKGYWNCGIILPYGYHKKDKKLEVDEEESKWVKKIFEMYMSGEGIRYISTYLNEKGVKTRYNKIFTNRKMKMKKYVKNSDDVRWSDSQIKNILNNPLYKGEREYKGVTISSPVIIEKDEYDKCQMLWKERRAKKGRRTLHHYILSDVTKICGVCGNIYYTVNTAKQKAFVCATKIKNTSRYTKINCENGGIGINKLTDCVWYCVRRTDELLKHIRNSFDSTQITNKLKILEIQLRKAKEELKLTNENEKYLVNTLLNQIGISRNVYEEKLSELFKEREKLNGLITTLNNSYQSTLELQERQNNLTNEIIHIKGDSILMKEYVVKIIKEVKIYPINNFQFPKKKGDNLPDRPFMISIYLKSSEIPLNYLISRRTDGIIKLNEGEFDYKKYNVIGTKKELFSRNKELKHISKID
jgi:site-specific DNA recombinase